MNRIVREPTLKEKLEHRRKALEQKYGRYKNDREISRQQR